LSQKRHNTGLNGLSQKGYQTEKSNMLHCVGAQKYLTLDTLQFNYVTKQQTNYTGNK